MAGLRNRWHPASLLYGSATNKTLTRDISYLRDMDLIRVEQGRVLANLELMNQFSD